MLNELQLRAYHDPRVAAPLRALYAQWRQYLTVLIHQGIVARQFRADVPVAAVVNAIIGQFRGIALSALEPVDDATVNDTIDTLWALTDPAARAVTSRPQRTDIVRAIAMSETHRVVATGGTGRVGRHVVQRLLEEGWEVSVLAETESLIVLSTLDGLGRGLTDPSLNVLGDRAEK